MDQASNLMFFNELGKFMSQTASRAAAWESGCPN